MVINCECNSAGSVGLYNCCTGFIIIAVRGLVRTTAVVLMHGGWGGGKRGRGMVGDLVYCLLTLFCDRSY